MASIPADAAAKTGFVPGLMYYSVGFMIFLAVLWLAVENKRFKGPSLGDEIAKRQAGIALQEKAERGRLNYFQLALTNRRIPIRGRIVSGHALLVWSQVHASCQRPSLR